MRSYQNKIWHKKIDEVVYKLSKHWKTSFEKKRVFSALASKLNTSLLMCASTHQIQQAKKIPYQPLLIKPLYKLSSLPTSSFVSIMRL